MKTVTLDCRNIDSRETLHRLLAEGLAFPEWYGGNLDALYDCLTTIHEDAEIRLSHPEVLEARLGAYLPRFLRALRHASEENAHLRILYVKSEDEVITE